MSSESSSTPQASPPQSTDTSSTLKNSSNLYLITFLATLFLLLFISCAIVLRSFVLRRRYRQRLEEAYAAGIVLTPRAQGSRKWQYGHKPKLYTLWIDQGGDKWRDMMPVSALPVQVKRRPKPQPSPEQDHQQQPPSTSPPPSSWSRLLRGISHDHHIIHPPPPEKSVRLQVSVLIAMPSPNKPSGDSRSSIDKTSDDESIPNVVFGVTRLPYKHNQITKTVVIDTSYV